MNRYQKEYLNRKKTSGEVAGMIPDHTVIATDLFLAEPKTLFEALNQRCLEDNIRDCEIWTALDLYPLLCYQDEKYRKNLRPVSYFCSGVSRPAVNSGLADFWTASYSDQPELLKQRRFDVFLASVSPMDENGYFSMGVTGSDSGTYLQHADLVFLEVNKKMPYCAEAPKIHVTKVKALCEADYDLPVIPPSESDPVSETIGGLIAEQIPDGACIQLGIGAIPDEVGKALAEKKHLGLHTEMLTSSMIDLLECGAVDNSKKETYTGTTVAAFAFGAKKIYDYIDHNPAVQILPVDIVNNPWNIAKNSGFISVNSALEMDLVGQVCAESIGSRQFSGCGGQVDFARGAVMSKGGKGFIAFPSTAKNGTISRIKPILTPGAIVTTSRIDVDMIVTEYGIAKLRGKTIAERVQALIAIAHPDFREELTDQAKKLQYI